MTKPDFGWNDASPTPAHRYLLPAIERIMPESAALNVIDIGCGNGWVAGWFADRGHNVVGVDAAPDGISLARSAHPGVRFEIASLYEDLTNIVSEVDLAICTEVIEHLYSPHALLENVSSVLRTGGTLILSTPYHGYLKNLAISLFGAWDAHHDVQREGGHIKFFSERTLTGMLIKAGFANVKFSNAGRFPLLWKSMVARAEKPC